MLTQFFGNYLVDKNMITSDQLLRALSRKHENNQTMASMAFSSGYMTEEEVEDVRNMQVVKDEEFTRIAFDMNYLTKKQAEELEEAHHFGYLLLARAVIDLGFCTLDKMAQAIADYEYDFQLSFSSCMNFDDDKIQEMMHNYYKFPDDGEMTPAEEYAVMLMHNIIRFVGDDFRLAGKLTTIPIVPEMNVDIQYISGDLKGKTAIVGYRKYVKKFAERYAGEVLEDDEYIDVAVQDFLNQHNGLYSITMSEVHDVEIELTATEGKQLDKEDIDYKYILPIEFTFGTIYFCFSI